MKVNKKILLSIVIIIMLILGISSIVKASYTVGQIVPLSYAFYQADPDLFCVEHNQELYLDIISYEVISEVTIEGNTSTDHTGKTIESWDNAKLAAILSADNGPDKESGPVQQALWNYMYTWMHNVGQYHEGLYEGFVNDVPGDSTSLDTSSSEYADQLKNLKLVDNTDKDKISVKINGDYAKIGPFNWSFSGNLTEVKIEDQNGNLVEGLKFSSYNGTEEEWFNVEDIKTDKDFYISIPISSGVNKITKISAKGTTEVKGVKILFLEATTGENFQNLISRERYTIPYEYETPFDYNIELLGNLKVIKVNKDNQEIKLPGVGFIIQNKETQKYVHQNENGEVSYVDKEQATEFITDQNGEISIENLVVGTYIAYETKNPNYGYEIISDGEEITVVIDKTEDIIIENKQVYVKLSGFVWLDKQFGKQSLRNDLYKDNDYDENDILMENVVVRLKDRTTGEVVKNDNGEEFKVLTKEIKLDDKILRYYQFVDVKIDNLENYYIEFEYDGLTYTNVVPHIDKDNGSKAAEDADIREQFNKTFATIEGATENTGVALDENGNVAHNLTYNKDKEQYKSTLINEGLPTGQYPITANTDVTDYVIKDHFSYGMEEIPYINLGLYEREQPDLALIKDIQNVRIGVNGYQHIYEYAQRFVNQGEFGGDGFNVGVKFGSKYSSTSYTRPIYKADYEYVNENDKSKELKVYVTYKIAIKNEATNLVSRVNNVVDYFDSRYSLIAVGDELSNEGIVSNNIKYTQEQYNEDYSKAIIDLNSKIEAQNQKDVYVQFELSREAVINILNDGEMLDNVVEINSYSTFEQNGNIYAGIDVDSNPGNAIPGDRSTFEDDTDSSPALKLEVADAREMTGKVFVDSTSGELKTGEIRQGSGAYEEGEAGVEGVTVTLTENTGSGKVYKTVTDANGDFYISDFIPGDYTLTYTWGDKTYTVQKYKGTVYSKERYDSNIANKEWYKIDVSNRLTDAVDDYETRLKIDEELKEITNSTTATTIDKMISTTPVMGIGVEYETTYTASLGDKYTYRIENVDFGIVERARQDIALNKRVKNMKLTLANGQTLVNFEVTEDGKLEGQTAGVVYLPPSPNAIPNNGLLKLEMDNELIEGSRLEVTYEFKAENVSELDYLSENYYKYGIVEGETITITPSAIIDYLDEDWDFNANNNSDWESIDKNDERIDLADEVYNSKESTIDDKKLLYTEKLAKELKPTENTTVTLNVSKLLTASQNIELDNETEVIKVNKTGGGTLISIPGNYIPGTGINEELDNDMAETIIITPNTGDNLNYIIPITVILSSIVILGVGIVFIKKKVLNK